MVTPIVRPSSRPLAPCVTFPRLSSRLYRSLTGVSLSFRLSTLVRSPARSPPCDLFYLKTKQNQPILDHTDGRSVFIVSSRRNLLMNARRANENGAEGGGGGAESVRVSRKTLGAVYRNGAGMFHTSVEKLSGLSHRTRSDGSFADGNARGRCSRGGFVFIVVPRRNYAGEDYVRARIVDVLERTAVSYHYNGQRRPDSSYRISCGDGGRRSELPTWRTRGFLGTFGLDGAEREIP